MPLSSADRLDKVFVGGGFSVVKAECSQAIKNFIKGNVDNCTHIAAVCSGTVVLAASGVLNGHRAATHWSLSAEVAQRYPEIIVEADEFIVRDGKFWTTSAIIGGIEIARLIIAEDLGKTASKRATSDLLNYHHRPSDDEGTSEHTAHRFKPLIAWIRANLDKNLSIELLAEQVGMHPRHFGAAFANATGQTPAKAIERIRVETAFVLVERTTRPFAAIAHEVGFRSSERMRRAFIRAFAMAPQELREKLIWPPRND